MTYFEKNERMLFGPNILTMTSTLVLSYFVQMGDQKILSLIFLSLVTCLLTKTIGVQDFLAREKGKRLKYNLNTSSLSSQLKSH